MALKRSQLPSTPCPHPESGLPADIVPSGDKLNSEFDVVAPRADALMESLRATGYSLPDAVSDLIDNSITAEARNIWLNFHWSGEASWVSILDDGHGIVVNQQKWDTLRPEKVIVMRSVGRAP